MAGKRSATSDLDANNWDREDEPEGAGTFTKASEEVLQKRVIKSAKRRNPVSNVRKLQRIFRIPFLICRFFIIFRVILLEKVRSDRLQDSINLHQVRLLF